MIRQITTGKVIYIKRDSSNIYDIEIENDFPFLFKAGQYISLFVNEKESRPFSIASSPRLSIDKNKIRLIIGPKENGISENYLKNLKINDRIKYRGPFGIFTFERTLPLLAEGNENNNICFIATRTGIAPFLGMIDYLTDINYKGKVFLYFGIRFSHENLFIPEFKKFNEQLDFDYKVCVSQPETDFIETNNLKKGYVTKYIENGIDESYFICGSTATVSSISSNLYSKGCKHVFFENYG